MCNGLKVVSYFSSNGSKVTPLLFKSNLPMTGITWDIKTRIRMKEMAIIE
jgi:hypothetical protein